MTFLSSGCLRAQRCGERTVGLLAWASSPADDPPDLPPRFSARYVRGLDGRDPHGDRPGRPVLVLASEPSMVRPARCRGEPAEPKSEHYVLNLLSRLRRHPVRHPHGVRAWASRSAKVEYWLRAPPGR